MTITHKTELLGPTEKEVMQQGCRLYIFDAHDILLVSLLEYELHGLLLPFVFPQARFSEYMLLYMYDLALGILVINFDSIIRTNVMT